MGAKSDRPKSTPNPATAKGWASDRGAHGGDSEPVADNKRLLELLVTEHDSLARWIGFVFPVLVLRDEVEDVLGGVAINVSKRRETFGEVKAPCSYLRKIAFRVGLRQAIVLEALPPGGSLINDSLESSEEHSSIEDIIDIHEAREKLDEESRQVLKLIFDNGLPLKAVGERRGYSTSTACRVCGHALDELKRSLHWE